MVARLACMLTDEIAHGRPAWGLDDPDDLDELLALLEPLAWHSDAACKEHAELSWIPGRGDDTVAPKAVCDGCLVRR